MTVGPAPCSAMCMRIPLALTVRWIGALIRLFSSEFLLRPIRGRPPENARDTLDYHVLIGPGLPSRCQLLVSVAFARGVGESQLHNPYKGAILSGNRRELGKKGDAGQAGIETKNGRFKMIIRLLATLVMLLL